MAWSDVPDKMAQYAALTYAPDDAEASLLLYFGAETLDDVPEHRREEFEEALDYRLEACQNLATSKLLRTQK